MSLCPDLAVSDPKSFEPILLGAEGAGDVRADPLHRLGSRPNLFGRLFALIGRYLPPSAGAAAPQLWGDANVVHARSARR